MEIKSIEQHGNLLITRLKWAKKTRKQKDEARMFKYYYIKPMRDYWNGMPKLQAKAWIKRALK